MAWPAPSEELDCYDDVPSIAAPSSSASNSRDYPPLRASQLHPISLLHDIVTGHANTPLPPKQPGSHYTHLEVDEIRLLILGPGKADSPLECELTVHKRTHRFVYEALSYAWGDSTKSKQIVHNGSLLQVTESLHSALGHLRSPTESRRIWVDAVCIDQDDAAEKAHQISLMNTIYSEAERVLVWLGPSAPESKPAFSLVNRVVRLNSQSSYWSLLGSLDASCPNHIVPDYVDFSPSNELQKLSTQDLNPLMTMLELPWFTRLWVYQGKSKVRDLILGFF
ncbi:Plasma membrane ATPase 1 [Apiospora kogelbergensis]|uniref:Plasma membrane ATPase 1 n=1 Tax=Apiospora kogelbergensis TaxID=1337665 RepID=A0AAW0Q7K4_9PEZI